MNIRYFIFTLVGGLVLTLATVQAQSAFDAPSIDPDSGSPSGSEKPKNPLGFGFLEKDRPKNAETEITAEQEATFDSGNNIAEFVGKVVVKDPQFSLFCDRLRVTLNKDRKGMELTEAFGNVIIIQENTNARGEKTKSIGRADKVTYEPATGNITLMVWPRIQQGVHNHIATEEGTIMILNREGRLNTTGGSRTMIVDAGELTSQP